LPQKEKKASALTFKREVPCASLHKDKAKMHASKAAASLSLHELGSDAAPTLTHLLGMSESARSYTLRALAPVTNFESGVDAETTVKPTKVKATIKIGPNPAPTLKKQRKL
jgi:hypothetical protein